MGQLESLQDLCYLGCRMLGKISLPSRLPATMHRLWALASTVSAVARKRLGGPEGQIWGAWKEESSALGAVVALQGTRRQRTHAF